MWSVSELSFDVEDGTASVVLDVLDPSAKRRILQLCQAPISSGWSCKLSVRIDYEALTDEARSYNPLAGEATHDRQIDAFNEPHTGG